MIVHYSDEFAQVLPSHINPQTFVRVAVGALRRNPQLMAAAESDPASLMTSLMEAARLGLEPGTKEYALTPRKNKGRPTVVGIIGYEGHIELIYRAGAVTSVKAELVRVNDVFQYNPSDDRPIHKVDWFSDRGEVRGSYAYAEMVGGGTSKVVVIGPAEIERARAASAGSHQPDSPWVKDFGAMVLKTAVRQLQKWVPTSAEYRREQLRAVAEVAKEVHGAPMAGPAFHVPPLAEEQVTTDVPGVLVDEDGVMYEIAQDGDPTFPAT
jgi:recombination protein RecT